jgi:ParB/RepB/Spo0J family partition protein
MVSHKTRTPKKPETATPAAGTEPLPEPFVPPAIEFETVPVGLIDAGRNVRPVTEADCADLAASIRQVGLLNHIVVVREAGRFRVIAGHRRLKALQMLGEQTTRIAILKDVSEVIEAQVQGVENIVRASLNPIDEAMSVARVVDACGGDFRRAALCFGRSESWVRDRGYIAKFDGKARELVASGRLPLGHARLIAKVTDPTARAKLAEEAAGDGPNAPPIRLVQLESRIGGLTRSLRLVPWELSASIGGLPACAGCPSNSDTDRYLFGVGESDGATCGNARCFEQKSKAAVKAIEKTVTRLTVKGKAADLSAETVREATPAGIKATSVQRAAKKAVGVAEPKKPASASKQDAGRIDTWKLEREWSAEVEDPHREKFIAAIAERILEKPDRVLKLAIETLGLNGVRAGEEEKAVARILDDRTSYDVLVEMLNAPRTKGLRHVLDNLNDELNELIGWREPSPALLKRFGVAPVESKKAYVERRTAEIKKAAATKAQAKPRSKAKPTTKAPKARSKRPAGKAVKR